jgi:hypothetical protein
MNLPSNGSPGLDRDNHCEGGVSDHMVNAPVGVPVATDEVANKTVINDGS